MPRIPAVPLPLALLDLKARDQRALQIRKREDAATIARYAEIYRDAPDSLPPIRVVQGADPTSPCWLVDGWHRVRAALRAGLTELPMVVIGGDIRRAQLEALAANGDHGLPLTQAERQAACKALLEDTEWRQWSDKRIAAHVHVSPQTVAKLRKQVPGAAVEVRQAANGKAAKAQNSRAKAAAKSRGQEAVQVQVGAATPTLVEHLAPSIAIDAWAHPIKARIIAALWLAGLPGVDRDTLAALIGGQLDVHPGQLRRGGWIDQDGALYGLSAAAIQLGQGLRWMVPGAPGARDHRRHRLTTPGCIGEIDEPAEPEELDASEADAPANPPAAPAAPAAPSEPTSTARSPLATRRLAWLRHQVADRIESSYGKRSMTDRETCALLLVVGAPSLLTIRRWTDDLLANGLDSFERTWAEHVADAIRTNDLPALPDLHTLCRFWQLDHAALEIQAERTITE